MANLPLPTASLFLRRARSYRIVDSRHQVQPKEEHIIFFRGPRSGHKEHLAMEVPKFVKVSNNIALTKVHFHCHGASH